MPFVSFITTMYIQIHAFYDVDKLTLIIHFPKIFLQIPCKKFKCFMNPLLNMEDTFLYE